VGQKLVRLAQLVRAFRRDLGQHNGRHTKLSYMLDELRAYDPRAACMLVKEQPERLRVVLRDLARLEVLWRIAEQGALQPVRFTADEIRLINVADISLVDGGTPSSVELSLRGTPHGVLTGPNGGGKSSFLRSLLQSVLFAHSYGVAPAEEAELPLLSWIASGLQLRDTPGVLSMFETEVKFAADCLSIAPSHHGPGLLLFDELFHSTNPPDGIRTAERFLQAVWKKPQVFSIISTHVFHLVESAPKHVLPICCEATEQEGGGIDFSYRVGPGICRVSSVETVWKRFGLGSAAAARPGPGRQTLSSEEKHAT
jgi:DNA mismatch repair ATPase MutS